VIPVTVRAAPRDRVEDLRRELASLTDDIDDLQEPVAEFERFDECMYLVGVSELGSPSGSSGYAFGTSQRRTALAFDLRGSARPAYLFLAFPAEEPPSIECDEDAEAEDGDD
jgi:hypothetical protein